MALTPSPRVLIIDDEPDIVELLELTLQRMQVQSCSASTMAQAMEQLANKHFDLCLTDMRLPDGDGLAIVRHIQHSHPQTPVAMITAYGSLDTAISALKAGAFDFLTKPVDLQRLRELVNSALRLNQDHAEQPADQSPDPILGISPPIDQLRKRIAKLARSQAPLYISGESGSGKELVARRIHSLSSRSLAPFVPVNCGAIPSELMESEFFGHRKGSFTGAVADKPGLFQAAAGGTLFLDEVADLPMSMQVKLLRAIQEKAVRPLGTQQEEPVDVRLLCATHKDLAAEVTEGRFRQDLFYRINVIELSVPPLRDRREDIPLLTQHILARLARRNQMPMPHIGADTMDRLASYRFPGNVRELENILERAFTLSEGEVIETDDIHISACPTASSEQSTPSLGEIGSLEDYLDNIERSAITQALEETRWNKTAAAKRLGLTFRSLRYRLKKLGMED
ncbi:MAG: sigma-54-dependent Fis family transcriptional regulator [Pseudomonas sp.]|nr:sigma-54-dependent Fis family transcriptional regulator [Pseudomonas sp.]